MSRGFLIANLVMASVIAAAPSASAQETLDGPLVVSNPVLAASAQRLLVESASFRQALEVLAPGRQVVLTTPERLNGNFDTALLAEARPVPDDQSRVNLVVVIVNLNLLQKLSGLPLKGADVEDDLDRILAHEVYGHAIPFLMAGSLAGNCADPIVGQSAAAACSIQRENVIRREMRLGQRSEYGRESLASVRRYRH